MIQWHYDCFCLATAYIYYLGGLVHTSGINPLQFRGASKPCDLYMSVWCDCGVLYDALVCGCDCMSEVNIHII